MNYYNCTNRNYPCSCTPSEDNSVVIPGPQGPKGERGQQVPKGERVTKAVPVRSDHAEWQARWDRVVRKVYAEMQVLREILEW